MIHRSRAVADKNQLVSGALVSYYAFYERRIEELFMGLLTGRVQHPSLNVSQLAQFSSIRSAEQIVRDGKKYIDWLPYDRHTLGRSKLYFNDGLPFTRLTPAQRGLLDELGVLRNALAHQSAHSLKRFEAEFVEGAALPSWQSTPAGYLRGDHALGTTRLEHYLRSTVGVMNALCQ